MSGFLWPITIVCMAPLSSAFPIFSSSHLLHNFFPSKLPGTPKRGPPTSKSSSYFEIDLVVVLELCGPTQHCATPNQKESHAKAPRRKDFGEGRCCSSQLVSL